MLKRGLGFHSSSISLLIFYYTYLGTRVCGHGCLDACAEARGDLWESVLSFYHQAPGDLTRAASVAPSPAEPSRQLSLCLPFREGFDYLHLNLSFCFGYFAAAAASAAVIVIILFWVLQATVASKLCLSSSLACWHSKLCRHARLLPSNGLRERSHSRLRYS